MTFITLLDFFLSTDQITNFDIMYYMLEYPQCDIICVKISKPHDSSDLCSKKDFLFIKMACSKLG